VRETKPIRPSQVTLAGWMIMIGSVVVVLTVFDQMGTFHTVEVREAVERFLAEPPADGLGLSVDGTLTLLRVLSMVAAGCASATAVLGWHVLRRDRASRVALTILAVPLFLTGMVAGGFFSSVVAASALMLWSRPARDWFDGVSRQAQVVHPSGARQPGTSPPPTPDPRPAGDPPPYAGFGSPQGVTPVVPAEGRTRPDQVMWACALTWSFSVITLAILAVSAVALAVDGTGAIDEVKRQNPDLDTAGMSDRMLLVGVAVFLVGLFVWAIAAMVVAWYVWKGREWARITLIVSSGLTVGLALIGLLTFFVTLPLLIASGVAMRLLLSRPTAAWCRTPVPPR